MPVKTTRSTSADQPFRRAPLPLRAPFLPVSAVTGGLAQAPVERVGVLRSQVGRALDAGLAVVMDRCMLRDHASGLGVG